MEIDAPYGMCMCYMWGLAKNGESRKGADVSSRGRGK